jgi:hypothetical protein
VVQLFNAVRQTQVKVEEFKKVKGEVVERKETKEKVTSVAKATFLDILRRGANRPAVRGIQMCLLFRPSYLKIHLNLSLI